MEYRDHRAILSVVRGLLDRHLRHHVAAAMHAALEASPDGYWFTDDMAGRLRKCAILGAYGIEVARTVEFVIRQAEQVSEQEVWHA
jgi:hypothetical protein